METRRVVLLKSSGYTIRDQKTIIQREHKFSLVSLYHVMNKAWNNYRSAMTITSYKIE